MKIEYIYYIYTIVIRILLKRHIFKIEIYTMGIWDISKDSLFNHFVGIQDHIYIYNDHNNANSYFLRY